MLLLACVVLASCGKRSGKPKVLVFTKTAGYHHESIPAGIAAIKKLGSANDFEVDTTTNPSFFSEDTLKQYSAVIFLNTTGDVLNNYQEADFERYIQAGGGFVGVHAATDTEYGWGWYGRLVGGYFNGHPEQQEAVLNVVDRENAATKHLPVQWKRKDEWYNFKKLNPDVKVLIKIDEKSYKGGANGADHPMAWYHDFEGGRAFYTELGHTDESYKDPLYLKHLLGGIQYAIGDNKELDYDDAKTLRVPEENRFVKTQLIQGGFFEPTEMAILPNFDILVTQRRGELMLYSNEKKTLKQVGFLDVYFKSNAVNVNSEEGLLGLTLDPDFEKNNYVYLYYSPAGDKPIDRLSRFVFKNDTLDNKSEKVILEVGTTRDICCHTGGSLAFAKDNILFLSVGDNTTPFDEPNQPYPTRSFGPMDDRPGHEQYDDRRAAGNTNDLRGKILRIKINSDGSYGIPDGNLFPKGTAKARPEIYVMGNRNPYRISVDKKTGYLYWGEVGPDAANDSIGTRGPRGYDEVNQARKAGNFGWPFFVGNNYAYNMHDYNTNKNGPPQDPAHPKNTSRNNTGLVDLPPAQPAYVWYPYAISPDFPELGTGGRTAMAGPVYYTEDFPEDTRYPDYYNGKFFMYDFIRGWIKAVTQLPNGDLDKIEPFMPNSHFNSMIDMEVGKDGRIYVLEYGNGWFNRNPDAGIVRIDYLSGNRPPAVKNLTIEKTSGNLPFVLTAKVEAVDPEKDPLTYVWHIGKTTTTTSEPQLKYTIKQAGEQEVFVEVMDDSKASAKSNTVTVFAGNERPEVKVSVQGNQSFFFPGKPVNYNVSVTDKGAPVDLANLYISADFIKGSDLAGANWGHQIMQATMAGKNLMLTLDCKGCHKVDETSIGPAFKKVAEKYRSSPDANSYLPAKIIKGGAGVWGEVAMPAHPTLKESDAKLIVTWIRSLADQDKPKSLPANGTLTPKASDVKEQNTVFNINANYTDAGSQGMVPLSGTASLVLRNSVIDAGEFQNIKEFYVDDQGGSKSVVLPSTTGSFKAGKFDLTGITAIEMNGFSNGDAANYTIEVYADKPNGNKLGTGTLAFKAGNQKLSVKISLQKLADGKPHDVYIVAKQTGASKSRPAIKTVRFI
ncbi:c-type cytochrome [Mucilaginibacter limnophilus]|uniref:C-type cytochrome n=1 Tax=Mucilaginibacter limnophilus TaxID=1932778 RepID=A0A437MWT8_9SPHI|nr:c-type cytochrome [Mucilaginibacter limnophilus]